MSTLSTLLLLWGCGGPFADLDQAHFVEFGSPDALRNPVLSDFVRILAKGKPDLVEFHQAFSTLLHGQPLDPPGPSNPPSVTSRATVLRFRGETFVMVSMNPTGVTRPGEFWCRLLLFDASGSLLDQVYGEVSSRDGIVKIDAFDLDEEHLACLMIAQPGAEVHVRYRQRWQTFHPRSGARDELSVVCQVGISDRRLKLLHSELPR